ncbi:MAG: DoxX family protein [Dehalococcoidia bacterium]
MLIRKLPETFQRFDDWLIRVLRARSVLLLRLSIGAVFLWFGLLKLIGRSPVADLVADTVPWFPADFFVPFLGAWEAAVGLGLIFAIALRVTLLFFLMQMLGTFLVLVFRWNHAFQDGNPLLLTFEGEFIIKNLVLIAGGLAIGSTVQRLRAASRVTTKSRRDSPLGPSAG